MNETEFDPREVPFSRCGSYFAISLLRDTPDRRGGLFLRTVRGGAGPEGALFRLELLRDGVPAPFRARAGVASLVLDGGDREVTICMPEAGTVRFHGTAAGLRLAIDPGRFDYDCAVPLGDERWRITSFTHRLACEARPLDGVLRVEAPWRGDRSEYVNLDFLPGGPSGTMDGVLSEIDDDRIVERHEVPAFEDECRRVRDEVDAWRARLGDPGGLAGYVMWSAIVAPDGHFARPAMLMSKNWMCQVWSWDHCFNALALAPGHPELCWDQFMVLFDHQRRDGRLPDSVSDRLVRWDFAKPPIHGWTLAKLMAQPGLVDAPRLGEVYGPLRRLARWWMDCRDVDHDGLPQYEHGNDSGWDNGTTFFGGVPVESPDLAAFLVLHMETLAAVARALGEAGEAREWDLAKDTLLSRMLERLWRGDRFVALRGERHEVVDTESLLPLVPLVLGHRLPPSVSSALVDRLRQRFLTTHGLATERPGSPEYQSDGYWRGPIWAPSTVLIVDGLFDLGETDLARDICRRFTALVDRSGMAENFDALTGEGLRDRAYTWTASGYLLLRRWSRS